MNMGLAETQRVQQFSCVLQIKKTKFAQTNECFAELLLNYVRNSENELSGFVKTYLPT
jgi:hypothetical protein